MSGQEAEAFRAKWKSHRADLLRRLSREVAPDVPFAPTTFAGHDRAACKCGPAAEFKDAMQSVHGGLECGVCQKPAPGAAQLAWLHGIQEFVEPGTWRGLRNCYACDEPAAVTHPCENVIGCLSCGERIARELLLARRAESDRRAEEAARRLAASMWRQRLCDMAAPSQSPKHAGRYAAAIDKAAEALAEGAVQPKGSTR